MSEISRRDALRRLALAFTATGLSTAWRPVKCTR